MFRNRTGTALKEVLESHGEDGAVRIVRETLESGQMQPEDYSIKEIWDACTKGASVTEAVASTSFPKLTGELINSTLISAYDGAATIGDDLITTVSSNVEIETFAGITAAETPIEVGEGQEYSDSSITEKYVTARSRKFGRLLSLTEETLYFDKTGQIIDRAREIGTQAAQYKEMQIVQGAIDQLSGASVYNPSSVGTAVYSTTNGNLKSSNAFSEGGLEAVQRLAHIMKNDSLGDDEDSYILINLENTVLLVPQELELEAWQMANSILIPEGSENAMNFYKGKFKVRSSPYLTADSATTWYWGDFKKNYRWVEVWPLQTFTQPPTHEDAFKSDIKTRFKVRYFGTPTFLDVKYVFKSTA